MVNNHQIIEKIYSLYKSNGFVREDKVLVVMDEYNLSLQDLDILTEELLAMGVIIRSEYDNTDDDEENMQVWTDYNEVFNEALSISSELSLMIEYVRNICPPKSREWRMLMSQASNGNQYAQNRLFEMYLIDAIRIALRFYKVEKIDLNDAVQECSIGLFKAIRNFSSDKQSSFQAFAQLCINRQIMTAIKTATRQKHIPLNSYISFNELIGDEEFDHTQLNAFLDLRIVDPVELIIKKEEYGILECKIREILSLTEQEVLLAYLNGQTYKEIAANLHCHVKSIDNAVQRIKRKLEHYFLKRLSRDAKKEKQTN